jgi:outer membrane protein assembly factor BamA
MTHLHLPLVGLLLVAQAAPGQPAPGPAPEQAAPVQAAPEPAPRTLEALSLEGGSGDDQAYARAALGLKVGDRMTAADFQRALAAVRVTDRFREAAGTLEETAGGVRAQVRLDPWPAVQEREWRGDLPKSMRKGFFAGMHRGSQAGDLRIARWQSEGERRLREAGYPEAKVRISREQGGARLVLQVDIGRPALVRTFELAGEPGPYHPMRLASVAGIQPGRTLWTDAAQREALARLRQRLIKDRRLEGTCAFTWDAATGRLVLQLQPGPLVNLRSEGTWSIWWKNIGDLVPLARAGRYDPELLDEGDRRILRYLLDKGYLDARVTHRRELLRGTEEKPEEVVVTYNVQPGTQVHLGAVRFERNRDIPEAELKKAASLPSGLLSFGRPLASPANIGTIEDRIKSFYWNQGYPDVALRRPPMERPDGLATLVFQVREGTHQNIDRVVLEMPSDPAWSPMRLSEVLALIFSGKVLDRTPAGAGQRIFQSDRAALGEVTGRLEETPDPGRPGVRIFTFTTSRPIPFVKNDLAAVYTALRQRMAALGVQRPAPRLQLEPGPAGYLIRFAVPDQERVPVDRLVVQGADYTQSRAIFRQTSLEPGMPLDPDLLTRAQGNLGALGAFQRVDLENLGDGGLPGGPWQEGDLLLKVEERPLWVLNTGFGYDKSHGYHIGLGAQRQNFMGMGRTLDFGIRAGDTTLNNPTLRKWFPTGDFNRSVDSFSVGYTDPWFLPGSLVNLLSPRTQYHVEAAYISETQAAFLARRRRILNTFDWKIGDYQTVQLGHRFERTDIKGNLEGIQESELFTMARVPGPTTTISAPFVQISVDRRDHPLDPTRGTYFMGRLELANQLFGTGAKYSFAKLDLRHQWNWPVGEQASRGVLMAAARIGLAHPTAASVKDLPLTERFFGGGPFTVRGVEPDFLGPVGTLGVYENQGGTLVKTGTQLIPLGGQGLVVLNLEYRFPLFGSSALWGEVFADSGQVYAKLNPGPRQAGDSAPFPPLRTTLGLGLILKLGLPIKFEYAADLKRILGRPRTQQEIDTQLHGILISAGYQY